MNHATALAPPTRFLLFNKFHIAPITDLTPDAIKSSAKECRKKLKDRENIKYSTCLNHIVKQLGFKGGFGEFTNRNYPELQLFMAENGLQDHKDLVAPRHKPAIIRLNPRQVADRLFLSGKPLPKRIFTGCDINWSEINDTFFGLKNPWTKLNPEGEIGLNTDFTYQDVENALSGKGPCKDNPRSSLLTSAVEAKRNNLFHWNNLLGDQLLDFRDRSFDTNTAVLQVYFENGVSAEQQREDNFSLLDDMRIFREWIEECDHGWAEILPYNDQRLIFLKGRDGEYDFLFQGLRNAPFEHNQFEPYLKNDDVPKSMDTYHFRRWLYFKYEDWKEKDEHEAEKLFYSERGKSSNHSGLENCHRSYLMQKGSYSPPQKTSSASPGFYEEIIAGRPLYVSNLVTVSEFHEFMARNPEYAIYSRKPADVDRWELVNLQSDAALPAAVTWYDANAYATWFNKTKKLPVRLLTENEYMHIARSCIPVPEDLKKSYSNDWEPLCRYYSEDGKPITDGPLSLPEPHSYDGLLGYIPDAINWVAKESGLKFLISRFFGEWLNKEGAVVNAKYLSAPFDPGISPYRVPFAPTSTGKYKSIKVGFRLCYLGEL